MKLWFAFSVIIFFTQSIEAQDEAVPTRPEFSSVLIIGSKELRSLPQLQIVDLEQKLWTAYQEQARDSYQQAVSKLNLQYGVAVDKQMSANDSTVAKLAVRAETKLLNAGESPLTPDGMPKPSEVEAIRKLREMYAEQHNKLIEQRGVDTRPLLAAFVAELGKLQQQLQSEEAKAELDFVRSLQERLDTDTGTRTLTEILTLAESKTADTAVKQTAIAAGLPQTNDDLEEFLKHTVWDVTWVTGDKPKLFRFRGDGKMLMPWHTTDWKVIAPRSVAMINPGSWEFRLDFSDDMTAVTARGSSGKGKDGWDGQFSRRITSAISNELLEQAIAALKWKLSRGEGKEELEIGFEPSQLVNSEPALPWRKWEVSKGILVISNGRKVVSEFYLESADRPYTLKGLTSKQSKWRLIGTGD